MFGTSKRTAKTDVDLDALAQLYLTQHPDNSETPEDFLARFVKIRCRMEQKFDEELQEYNKQHGVPMPVAVSKMGNNGFHLTP